MCAQAAHSINIDALIDAQAFASLLATPYAANRGEALQVELLRPVLARQGGLGLVAAAECDIQFAPGFHLKSWLCERTGRGGT